MSKIDERKMDCPSCKQEFSAKIYSSAHIDNPHDRAQIFNDKINVATCPHCDVGIQIDTPLLCANHKLKFAVWYDPNHDEQIDGAANLLDKALGANNYLLRAPRISNWEALKAKILELEEASKTEKEKVANDRPLVLTTAGNVKSRDMSAISGEKTKALKRKLQHVLILLFQIYLAGVFLSVVLLDWGSTRETEEERGYLPSFLSYPILSPLLSISNAKALVWPYFEWEKFNANHSIPKYEGYSKLTSDNIASIHQQAETGDAYFQAKLGDLYYRGQGVSQNFTEAAHWFQKSADQGYAAGQEGLATLYLFGNGVDKNIMESKRLLLLSANQGFVPAEGDLGILSMSDRDAPHNYVEAYFWLSLASMSGDADSAQEVSTQELKDIRDKAASMLTPQEISEVQNRVQSWRPLVR